MTNQCLAAKLVYLFIRYGDLTYEIMVHASDCTISKAVRIGLNLQTY